MTMPQRKAMREVLTEKDVNPPNLNVPEESIRPSPFLSRERREERRGKIDSPETWNKMADYKPSRRWVWLTLSALAVLVVLGIVFATVFASAKVTVTPLEQRAILDEIIRVYKTNENSAVPHFEIITATLSENTFVPAGSKKYIERKASGRLTLYNEYSKQSVRIIKNTRFQTSDGKIYRSYAAVAVPGYKETGNTIIPGSVEVSVSAEKVGEQYNIGPSRFTLPGLAGGPMFDKMYAKSDESITGGFVGEVGIVSDSDLIAGRNTLEGLLASKLIDEVKSKVPDDKIFFPEVYRTVYEFDEYVGSATSTDNNTQEVRLTGVISAAVFDKSEFANYLARRELSNIGEAMVAVDNWQELTVNSTMPDEIGVADDINLRVSGNANFVWQFDADAVAKDLVGLPKTDYEKVFLNYPAIYKAEVRISPFWVSHFPSNPSRIHVDTE